MGVVIQIEGFKAKKAAELAEYPALECPVCDTLCLPVKVDSEGSVHHHCKGNGHRAMTWRIASDGSMLRGRTGKRHYQI